MRKIFMSVIVAMAAALSFSACDSSKNKNKSDEDDDDEDKEAVENVDEQALKRADAVVEPTGEATAGQWMPDDARVMPSGLGIVIENPGSEVKAGPNSLVSLHYRGRLTNGTVFDSSYDRGEPATFSPAQVIPGFSEGIQLVGVGGKATLYIPGDLAYGPYGVPQAGIGPDENLIFDIEVLDVN